MIALDDMINEIKTQRQVSLDVLVEPDTLKQNFESCSSSSRSKHTDIKIADLSKEFHTSGEGLKGTCNRK